MSDDGHIRKTLTSDGDYPADLLSGLVSSLVKDLSSQTNDFTSSIRSIITTNLLDCKKQREIKVPDLPEQILTSVNLLLKLLRLNVMQAFELHDQYSIMLQICFQIFDFNQLMPAQFIFLEEIKLKEILLKKKPKKQQVLKKKVKGPSLIGKYSGLDEEVLKSSLLSNNYFLLKNKVSNKLKAALTYQTNFDLEATRLSVLIFSKFMDLRLEFLLENWTECVRLICPKFAGKPFNEHEDQKLFALCTKETSVVFPPAIKTSIVRADSTQLKITFKKFTKDSQLEIYDLSYLVKHAPSIVHQSNLNSFQNIITSVIVAIIFANEESFIIDTISLFFKMFSQRRSLIEAAKRSFAITGKESMDSYSQVLNYNQIFYKMLEKIDFWGRNEELILESAEMIEILDEVAEKLDVHNVPITPAENRRSI